MLHKHLDVDLAMPALVEAASDPAIASPFKTACRLCDSSSSRSRKEQGLKAFDFRVEPLRPRLLAELFFTLVGEYAPVVLA
jgi:hypothetical protein